jgi:hypothetical protein
MSSTCLYILLVLDEFVPYYLLQVSLLVAQLPQTLNHILYQVEPVRIILHSHIEDRRDRDLFLVTPDVEVAIRVHFYLM